MSNKLIYIPLLVIPLIIGLFHGFLYAESVNVFISWLLIGIWLCFTVYFFQKLKQYREFGSPHNTTIFILGPLFIGVLYSLWGYYTGLLDWNLFGSSELYISFWIVIFALPYLLRGLFALFSCFKRYDIVYIGGKAISARKFGIFAAVITIIITIFTLLFSIIFSDLDFPLIPIHSGPDLMLLITTFFAILLLIRYGIFGSQPSLSDIAASVSSRQRPRPEPVARPARTSSSSSSSSETRSRSQSESRSSPPRETRTTRSTTSTTESTRSTRSRSSTRTETRTKTERKTKEEKVDIKKYLPKAAKLSIEDFKCIFCFKLPEYPADKDRGIVLCPNCRYPSHADEFKNWLKDSNLCSRCDKPIPARYRRDPIIVSAKLYASIINRFLKKKKT